MELFANLAMGLEVAVSPVNLAYAFVGCFFGTLIGVLPGIGAIATVAMLLPATYGLPPVSALIMLAGIYYGAQYGGSTTAILVNLPGETSSVVTALEGYRMARNGRAGPALMAAGLSSFIAGTMGTLLLAAFAVPMTALALKFGAAEYVSLMTLGLVSAVALAAGSVIKAVGMTLTGILLGTVGTDLHSGLFRFTLGLPELSDGLGFIVIAMGIFGYAEIIANLSHPAEDRKLISRKVSGLMPTRDDLKRMLPAVFRGVGIGAFLGVLPGGGATIASFGSYSVERKLRPVPGEERFGSGNIRGVAGPEAANNSAAQTSFIPLLALGIPPNPVMALMAGAMMIHNIQPGPQVMTSNPSLFWGLIVSMWIGNVMLLILNLPLVGIWVKLLSVPYRWLFPAIILFCALGVLTANNNPFDIWLVAVFGLLGYVFLRLGMEPAPLLLGYILGPMMEENLRRALSLAYGDWTVFITRPISGSILLLAVLLIVGVSLPIIRRKLGEAFS